MCFDYGVFMCCRLELFRPFLERLISLPLKVNYETCYMYSAYFCRKMDVLLCAI